GASPPGDRTPCGICAPVGKSSWLFEIPIVPPMGSASVSSPSRSGEEIVMQPLRYLYICLFIAFIPLPLLVIEWLFRVSGSGLSLTDSRGVGQVTLLVMILLLVAGFTKVVAGLQPFGFFLPYLRQWRRALAGFAA